MRWLAWRLWLALPIQLDYWYTLQSMVLGMVLFSMLAQGNTNGLLIKRFG